MDNAAHDVPIFCDGPYFPVTWDVSESTSVRMERSTSAMFTNKLDQLNVDWSQTSSTGFREVISSIVEQPAVASPLPFDDIQLPASLATVNPAAPEIENARTGITAARLAIASYGTIVIHQNNRWNEPVSLLPPVHVAVLRSSDILPDMTAAFRQLSDMMADRATSVVMATGPSATADMGALVRGAHGPATVHVIILTDL